MRAITREELLRVLHAFDGLDASASSEKLKKAVFAKPILVVLDSPDDYDHKERAWVAKIVEHAFAGEYGDVWLYENLCKIRSRLEGET